MQEFVAETTVQSRPISSLGANRRTSERRFYFGVTLFLTAVLVLGFARTFFLRPWFQEWAQIHGAMEPFFLLHGAVFVAWFALLISQTSLIATRRVSVHKRLGWVGAGLAVLMVIVGIIGSLIAARRPTGFIDVPAPPLQFLIVPLGNTFFFALFFGLAILKRRKPQAHKRLILIATIYLLEAAVVRWPFPFMFSPLLIPGFTVTELAMELLLLPMITWDLSTTRRLHPVTLFGALSLIAFHLLRFTVSATPTWLAFATSAVRLFD